MDKFEYQQKFKYKPFDDDYFLAMVKKCREEYPRRTKENLGLLTSMGIVNDNMKWDILRGEVELYINKDGDIEYIDHRVTKEVMKRILDKEK